MPSPALPDDLRDECEAAAATPHPFASVVVPHDDDPDECTVFPIDVPETELMSQWITAEEGSFVPVHEMR
jgi:hypothetical protein